MPTDRHDILAGGGRDVSPAPTWSDLDAAVTGARDSLAAADQLCHACVRVLEVDGASISVIDGIQMRGTFGPAAGSAARGTSCSPPSVGALPGRGHPRPALVDDLDDVGEQRWPALGRAFLEHGAGAVFALPIAVSATCVGALDLYRRRSGPLDEPGCGTERALLADRARRTTTPEREARAQIMRRSRGHRQRHTVLHVPQQRRPLVTHQCERYESLPDMLSGTTLRVAAGWAIVQAGRCDDGTIEVLYER